MSDYKRNQVNPLAIGVAAAVGAAAAWLFSSDENRKKAKHMYNDLKGKAQDLMESSTEKVEEVKEDLKSKAAAGRRRIMNTPPEDEED